MDLVLNAGDFAFGSLEFHLGAGSLVSYAAWCYIEFKALSDVECTAC